MLPYVHQFNVEGAIKCMSNHSKTVGKEFVRESRRLRNFLFVNKTVTAGKVTSQKHLGYPDMSLIFAFRSKSKNIVKE